MAMVKQRSRTRGYGMALLLLLASSSPSGGAWLPRFSFRSPTRASARVQTLSSSAHASGGEEGEEEKIAKAWNRVDQDMNRNDKAALEVLKELRDSFKSLEASASASKAEPLSEPPLVQAHEIMDQEAAELVAQLASQEAMEYAQKESRIAAAKEASEGVLLQAKLDLQQQQQGMSLVPLETPEMLQAHDVKDAEAAQLVAELAALDAAELAAKESLINSAREASQAITMEAKIDQQEATPLPPKEVPGIVIPQAHDLKDQEAANLVAELAALDANELAFKESLIDSAREASEGITMNAKLDQQLALVVTADGSDSSVEESVTMSAEDAKAAHLVAQLAAQDAAELAAKESLINAARDASEMVTMQAKIDQQLEQQQQQQQIPDTTKEIPEKLSTANDEEAARLVAELAALDARAAALRESLLESARAESEGKTMQAKLDQQLQEMQSLSSDTSSEEDLDHEDAWLVAQLASDAAREASEMMDMQTNMDPQMDASEEALATTEQEKEYVCMARELATQPMDPHRKVAPSKQQARQLKSQLASLEAAKFAVLMDMVKSKAVHDEAQAQDAAAETPPTVVGEQAKLLAAELAMEARQFAIQVDLAKSEAVKEDVMLEEAIAFKQMEVRLEEKRLNAQAAAIEAAQFAMQVDTAKSDAVMQALKVEAEKAAMELEISIEEKRRAAQATSIEIERFAVLVDMAKSDAVNADANMEAPVAKNEVANGQKRNGVTAFEVEHFARQVDMAKSHAVYEDARLDALRAIATQAKPAVAGASVAAAQVIEPVVLAAEKITKALMEEETAVEAVAEPFFAARQDTNQNLEVIDVDALKLAAQEVQEASEMLASHLPESDEKDSILEAAQEAAASVMKEVQAREGKAGKPNKNGVKGASSSKQTMPQGFGLEPLPQDVKNYQEDAKRFFFAKRAAQEISMKKDPYYLKQTTKHVPKELSAAELAAKEHDEVDRELKELFKDVSLGFKEVKQSLSRLLRNDSLPEEFDGMSNSTAWDGVSP